jgi:hypothetical protein
MLDALHSHKAFDRAIERRAVMATQQRTRPLDEPVGAALLEVATDDQAAARLALADADDFDQPDPTPTRWIQVQ